MKDDRTARLLQLLSSAGQAGESLFPGGRPGLLRWLDQHPGPDGQAAVERVLQHRLEDLKSKSQS